ncbi:MAG: hypothetical protein ACRD2A_20420 [Vicinamibacterales bacterium]
MTRARLKGAAALVFAISLTVVAWDSQSGQTVEVEGYVYSARDSSGAPGAVAAGAIVSTSLDAVTAVTDHDGHFRLRTGRRVSGDEFYTISVQSAGTVFRQRTMGVPLPGSDFVLATPTRIVIIYPPYERSR